MPHTNDMDQARGKVVPQRLKLRWAASKRNKIEHKACLPSQCRLPDTRQCAVSTLQYWYDEDGIVNKISFIGIRLQWCDHAIMHKYIGSNEKCTRAITKIIAIANSSECFLDCRCSSKHFPCFNSFNLQKHQKGSSVVPFCR